MTTIAGSSGNVGPQVGGATSLSSMQNQINTLQRQCADWAGCATTPPVEREKQENIINQQIQVLQTRIDKIQQVSAPSNVVTALNPVANIDNLQTGVNRPIDGAVSGSVINISV